MRYAAYEAAIFETAGHAIQHSYHASPLDRPLLDDGRIYRAQFQILISLIIIATTTDDDEALQAQDVVVYSSCCHRLAPFP